MSMSLAGVVDLTTSYQMQQLFNMQRSRSIDRLESIGGQPIIMHSKRHPGTGIQSGYPQGNCIEEVAMRNRVVQMKRPEAIPLKKTALICLRFLYINVLCYTRSFYKRNLFCYTCIQLNALFLLFKT
jgi:hypothetical protein